MTEIELDGLLADAADGRAAHVAHPQWLAQPEVAEVISRVQALDRAMLITPFVPAPALLTARIMAAAREAHRAREGQLAREVQLAHGPALGIGQIVFLLVAGAALLFASVAGLAGVVLLSGVSMAGVVRGLANVGQGAQAMTNAIAGVLRTLASQPLAWVIGLLCLLMLDAWIGVLGVVFVPRRAHPKNGGAH